MKDSYKIAIVCNHLLFLDGLATMVYNIGYRVHLECHSSNELISNLDIEDLPDLLLFYQDNDYERNEAVITELCISFPSMQILIITNSTDYDTIKNLIVKGAKGFVYISVDSNELKRAINKVMKHKIYYPDAGTQGTHNTMSEGMVKNIEWRKIF
ncbi:hypothetical protein BH11BAC3_BH11BAC3_28530 [soil metagenome]